MIDISWKKKKIEKDNKKTKRKKLPVNNVYYALFTNFAYKTRLNKYIHFMIYCRLVKQKKKFLSNLKFILDINKLDFILLSCHHHQE